MVICLCCFNDILLIIGQLTAAYCSTILGILVNCLWYISQLLLMYWSTVTGISAACWWNIGLLLVVCAGSMVALWLPCLSPDRVVWL